MGKFKRKNEHQLIKSPPAQTITEKTMQNHTTILQDICKAAGLLPGTPGVSHAEAMDWALQTSGFSIQPSVLQPVLATLGDKTRTTNYRFDAQKINLSPEFFPKENATGNIQNQLNTLKKELEQYNGDLTQMMRVLEWQGSSIACHPKFPDISVYDFVKTSAAIAHSLSTPGCSGNLRLIGASVSGIQTYLYDIISKNAAKLLKGRSFYVQLLTDSLLDELLKHLDLPPYSVVYSSGGGFYVIAPDTSDIKARAGIFFETAATQIYEKHKTTLFVDWELSGAFDSDSHIDAVWDDLLRLLNRRKYKRLAGNGFLQGKFFEPAEFGGTAEKDRITNVELDGEEGINIADEGEPEIRISELTNAQIKTGQALRNANFWATSRQTSFLEGYRFEIKDPFGKYHWLEAEFKNPRGEGQLRTINQITVDIPAVFYGGNKIPLIEKADLDNWKSNERKPHIGTPKMFDQLAQGTGLDRLGVLRMDVDSLGKILSENAGAAYGLNLARYAAISRSLDWFFKGYLNTLHKKFHQHTIIVYSGGDDLFILGRWREVLEFAIEIRQEFKRWVCDNSKLTISGGMAVVPGKFPVMQASKMAEKAEDAAKDHGLPEAPEILQEIIRTKNSFTLFNVPLHWETEFRMVEELKEDMLPFFRSKPAKLTSSFLTKISAHAIARHTQEPENTAPCFKIFMEFEKQEKKNAAPRWRWQLAWDLSRYRDTVRDAEARAFVDQVIKDAFANNNFKNKKFKSRYHYLDLLLVAARWVELQRRTEEKSTVNDKIDLI